MLRKAVVQRGTVALRVLLLSPFAIRTWSAAGPPQC